MDLYTKLLNTKEALHANLVPYLNGIHLQHPLIYSVFHSDEMNAMVNYRYEHTLQRIEECMAKDQWDRIPFMYERPYRVNAFYDLKEKYSSRQYWELLSDVYIDTENLHQNVELWYELLFASNVPKYKHYFMSAIDRKAFKNLPDVITIYRGCETSDVGYSWSLSEKTATFFANRFNRDGVVLVGTVEKSDCLGLLLGRGEQEIVVDWGNVTIA